MRTHGRASADTAATSEVRMADAMAAAFVQYRFSHSGRRPCAAMDQWLAYGEKALSDFVTAVRNTLVPGSVTFRPAVAGQ